MESAERKVSLDRIILYLLAAVVFALPLFILPGISEYGYGKTIIALVAISILTILRGIDGLLKGTWTIRIPWIAWPVAGLVVASLLSLIHAMSWRVVLQSLAMLVFFFQFVMLTVNLVRDRKDAHLLLGALLASAFLAGLYGLFQYLGIMPGPTGEPGLNEIISTLGNRNYLGGFLTYLLFPSVVLVVRLRSRILRALAILMIAFGFAIALLLQQTAVVVMLVAASILLIAGILVFRTIDPIRRNRGWLLILLGVLALTFMVSSPSGPLNSIVGISAQDAGEEAESEQPASSWLARFWARNSGSVRAWDWWVGWEMLKDHPITGVGLGNYKLNFVPYKARFLSTPRGEPYDFHIPRAAQAHNDYVQAAAELGLLGCLAVVGLLAVFVFTVWLRLHRNRDEADRFDLLLLVMGIIAFLGHALVSFPVHLPASMLAVLVVTGLIFSPAYGPSGVKVVRLGKRSALAALVAASLVGLTVSVIGLRDLSANFLMTKGLRQLQLGQSSLAEATFQQSIARDFAPRQTYFHLAGAQMMLGKTEEALVSLEMCLSRFTDESAYLLHANVATSLGQTEAAQESIDLLLASGPSREMEAKVRYLQANLFARAGQTQTALEHLNALVEFAPDYEPAHIALGSIFEARGLPETARLHYQTALEVIEEKLARIESSLAGRVTIPYAEYAELRQSREQLTQQRDAILDRLSALSSP